MWSMTPAPTSTALRETTDTKIMKKMTITIGKGGATSELKTEGFSGGECKTATKSIKAILGSVEESEDTQEFYQASACDTVNE